ncbi:hypothetical protein NOD94_023440 [Streptomyces sp. Isolate_45]|nr:hypothetical protein [Streptomyces sp. Isolate_45]MDA5283503.1 hypothetical protein [Streptomyces sp. Isolate_45]
MGARDGEVPSVADVPVAEAGDEVHGDRGFGAAGVTVTAAPGTPVRPAENAYDRLGHVIATGPDTPAVTASLDAALNALRVDITPPPN